jgi:amino acid adenylation domain-containing protein
MLPNLSPKPMNRIEESFPLTPMQQGMLFNHLSAPQTGVDILQMIWSLREALDVRAFRKAWERVFTRHSTLRTAFRWEGLDEPHQQVYSQLPLPWIEEDWRRWSPVEQAERLETYLQSDRQRGFDLERPPLVRLALVRLDAAEYQLIVTIHHALIDGRSFPLLVREVFSLYEALLRGDEIDLPVPPAYRNYTSWLRNLDLSRAEMFWRRELKGVTGPTPLTVDRLLPHDVASEGRHGNRELRLTAETTAALQAFAAGNQVTMGTLVQGAWALLLARYSGESEVVFGGTRACRKSAIPGAESMIGLFINTLPLRVPVPAEQSLAAWLKDVRARWSALRDYEHTPLAQVQTWSEIPGNLPMFESIVVYDHEPLDARLHALGGKWARRSFRLSEQTNYPLTLAAYGGAELCLRIDFDRARFDDATVARMLGHLRTLLSAMTQNPWQKLGEMPMLTDTERSQLLDEWNSSDLQFAPGASLVDWFEKQVEKTPENVAVVCDDQRLTYRELNARANRLARHLRQLGVGPESLVGLFFERSVNMVVALVGILKAGGAYVPMDPAYPRERLAFMIDDSQLAVLVTENALLENLPDHHAKTVCLDEIPAMGADADGNLPSVAAPGNLAYIIYTSGSTGRPKGVQVTHHNVVRLFRATDPWFRFSAQDVWTLFHSIAFDFSVWELWGALLYGGRLVVVPYLVSRSPEAFHELLAREHVTVLNQTPSAFRQLIQADESAPASRQLSLRHVVFGGEALELRSLRPWFERHGDQRPQLVNMYGITETTVHVSYRPLTKADLESGSVIGGPIPDLQVYILGPNGQPVPIGVPGEIFVGGAGVARGYLRRAELTAERFLSNPFRPGTVFYRTGDLARFLPNRDIEYLGRVDDQVKIRGFRIEPGEIESALCTHPAVREAVVLAHAEPGQEKRLVAFVVARGAAPAVSELREHLRTRLADYMVPATIAFLDQLPLTNHGKVDRKALKVPAPERPELSVSYVAPRSPLELSLAAIWKKILRLDQVGIDDNFFELGGNSLLMVQLLGKVQPLTKTDLEIAHLFQYPTIRALADFLERPEKNHRPRRALQRAQRQAAALRDLVALEDSVR